MAGRALEPAYVLHARPYRESSLLLELLTAAHGRLGVVARGARRPRSPLRGLLRPFQPLLAAWSGRGELRTLAPAEPAGPPHALTGRALVAGLHLNALACVALAREDPHPELFAAYGGALAGLTCGDDLDTPLRRFELALLEALGYAPLLARDRDGHPVEPGSLYHYEPERGPARAHGALGQGVRLHGATLLALARGTPLAGRARAEARALLRLLLEHHLGARQRRVRTLLEAVARPLAAGADREET